MNERAAKRLHDAERAAELALQFVRDVEREQFFSDLQLQAAVERKFEIIGEALNWANAEWPELRENLPELAQIVGMRNRIVHGYDAVDYQILWDTIHDFFPELIEQLRSTRERFR